MQLYPESAEQLELITTIALRCGFSGGLVVDYPNSRKARKHYLCLFAGLDAAKPLPAALGDSAAVAGAGAGSSATAAPSAVSFAGRASASDKVSAGGTLDFGVFCAHRTSHARPTSLRRPW